MLITIAVIFVLLATFLLIIINMYSDYVSRREQDARLIANKANNIIAECEELLLNQSQVAFSKTLVLVLHYRIIRALRKRAIDPKRREEVKERIANEERMINEIKQSYKDSNTFKAPENDAMALTQLRTIRHLRGILKSEMKSGVPINPTLINKEDRRLYVLVLKVNLSNLIQKVFEMKRLKQSGTCKTLIEKGLSVIKQAGVKDNWIQEKEDLLNNMLTGLNAEKKTTAKPKQDAAQGQEDDKSDLDEIFGDKKKW
ncbi:hypothetical protein [Succinivibrio dextrinosolvens]|jgi:hypothetical protein|uniref:hypothetical protein n=1 Tax=Succinivibrio dextrinosolvens TaxID=83771 RepID=UPI0004E1850A|nr:hypothetical protein [Succinivibrio dextrinosolvens]MBE6422730.1 hypothetical protein [Succinivibrio dextrinosolvens]MBQ3678448.1 hypothetical protein [Succinivibrio sp.]